MSWGIELGFDEPLKDAKSPSSRRCLRFSFGAAVLAEWAIFVPGCGAFFDALALAGVRRRLS